MGRDWLSVLKLNWSHLFPSAQAEIKKLSEDKLKIDGIRLQELINEFPTIFSGKPGCFKDLSPYETVFFLYIFLDFLKALV